MNLFAFVLLATLSQWVARLTCSASPRAPCNRARTASLRWEGLLLLEYSLGAHGAHSF